MTAPHTLPENVTSLTDLVIWSNTITKGWYGDVVFWMFFVVFFLAFKQTDSKKAIAGSSFLASVLGILLFQIQLVSLASVIIAITITAFSVLLLIWGDSNI